MKIQRVDGYIDPRFPKETLNHHAAYEVDGQPCWWEQTDAYSAVLHGSLPRDVEPLVEEIRFHAGHLTRFVDALGNQLALLPAVRLFLVPVEAIQPSQFLVDEEKLRAVQSFVRGKTEVVIPLSPWGDRYVAQDGHTRLKAAALLGLPHVLGFLSEDGGEYLAGFVEEARRRGVRTAYDLPVIPHSDYAMQWDAWCERFFQSGATKSKS